MYTLVDMLQCRGRAALRVKAEKGNCCGSGGIPIFIVVCPREIQQNLPRAPSFVVDFQQKITQKTILSG